MTSLRCHRPSLTEVSKQNTAYEAAIGFANVEKVDLNFSCSNSVVIGLGLRKRAF